METIMLPTLPNETIVQAQQGHAEPVGAIYRHYHQRIFRYLYYRVGDQQTAEDLTSEVFLRMVRSLSEFRLEGTPFQAWLFRIARNIAIDHFRVSQAHPTAQLAEAHPAPTNLERIVERSLTSERLQAALAQIAEEQREVIVMRFVLGMNLAETAQAIHRSEDAVKGLQRRGLMALKEHLKDLEVFS
ncbi:MAG: sigma-70 family RNA polymerase sigma factor [Chloroflexota bacterium]